MCVCVCAGCLLLLCSLSLSLLSLKGCFLCSGNLALLGRSNNSTDGPNLLSPYLSGETSPCPVPPPHTCLPKSPGRPPSAACLCFLPGPPSQEPSHSNLAVQAAPALGGQTSLLCAPTEPGKLPGPPTYPASTKCADLPSLERDLPCRVYPKNGAPTESKRETLVY